MAHIQEWLLEFSVATTLPWQSWHTLAERHTLSAFHLQRSTGGEQCYSGLTEYHCWIKIHGTTGLVLWPLRAKRIQEQLQIKKWYQNQTTEMYTKWGTLNIFDCLYLKNVVKHLNSSTCCSDTLPTGFFSCLEMDVLKIGDGSLILGIFPKS